MIPFEMRHLGFQRDHKRRQSGMHLNAETAYFMHMIILVLLIIFFNLLTQWLPNQALEVEVPLLQ